MDMKFSIMEAQKVAYFLQSLGWPLGIEFLPSFYGPYSQDLNRFISHVEGHYMTGYGDGTGGSEATLRLHSDAIDEAWRVLGDSVEFRAVLQKFENLVEGFEFPYGMELLSWSARKRSLFKPTQASAAFQHLIDCEAVLV